MYDFILRCSARDSFCFFSWNIRRGVFILLEWKIIWEIIYLFFWDKNFVFFFLEKERRILGTFDETLAFQFRKQEMSVKSKWIIVINEYLSVSIDFKQQNFHKIVIKTQKI